jgi:hypothetical protein
MKTFLSLALCLFALNGLYGQKITRLVWLDGEEVSDLLKRELVICAYTESEHEILRLKKRHDKASGDKAKALDAQITYHENIAKLYNSGLQALIRKVWKLHSTEDIKVKSWAELKKMKGNYTVIGLRYFSTNSSVYDPMKASIDLPALFIQGIEHFGQSNKIVAMPVIYGLEETRVERDLELSLKLLQKLVEANKGQKKRVDIDDLFKAMIAANCSAKQKAELLVNRGLLKGIEPGEVREAYGHKVSVIKDAEFATAYQSDEENVVAVCFPATVAESNMGIMSFSAMLFGRMVINTETAEVYGYANTLIGEKAGEMVFKKGHFSAMGECK